VVAPVNSCWIGGRVVALVARCCGGNTGRLDDRLAGDAFA